MQKYLMKLLKEIEAMKDDVIAYAYKAGNDSMTHTWWEISISDFDLYTNECFRSQAAEWRNIVAKRGARLVFVCGWTPTENQLLMLANTDNLILNI